MYQIVTSKQYKKSRKLAQKRGLDLNLLDNVVEKLQRGEELEQKYCDHALKGAFKGYRECHILPDWLLVYKIEDETCILYLVDTGSHSDLF